jgi:transposase
MLRVEQIEEIRQAYYREGKSIRQIAREQRHSRTVVAAALQEAEPRKYTLATPRSSPVLGEVISLIAQWLADDLQRPKKQRHTAHRVWQRLRDEYGFVGAESTVRAYVRDHRPLAEGARAQEAMLILAYKPGDDAQADFYQAQAIVGGTLTTIHVCALRLCYSKLPFLMAFPHERQEVFLEGVAEAFRFFEGVPARVTFDNPTTLVRKVLEGHSREEQDAFVAFRSHYVFSSFFCTPREGHEKGEVENLVGASRRNFLVPLPEVGDFAELNTYLRDRCEREKTRTLRGETNSIGELWREEKADLRALPTQAFHIGRVVPVIASRSATVTFETNRYSVPALYQKRELLIRASAWRIEVIGERGTSLIATHKRCYERNQDILDPRHYLGLLAQRPNALEHCKAIQQWERDGRWPTVFGRFLTALRAAHPVGGVEATREYVKILALYAEPKGESLPIILERALELRCFSLEGVKLLLDHHLKPDVLRPQLVLRDKPNLAVLARIGSDIPNLAVYDRLLGRRETNLASEERFPSRVAASGGGR